MHSIIRLLGEARTADSSFLGFPFVYHNYCVLLVSPCALSKINAGLIPHDIGRWWCFDE